MQTPPRNTANTDLNADPSGKAIILNHVLKNPPEMNYLLQRWCDVPGFNPYMNNKYVHIGHAKIFQLSIISAWIFNLKLAENLF